MTSPRKRRWFAFRLRTLLVVVVVLGCALMPLAVKLKKAREQKKAVEWVLENGGTVTYDWQSNGESAPSGPKWLRRWFGDNAFQEVRVVSLNKINISEFAKQTSNVTPLEYLTDLQELDLTLNNVSDLSPLTELRSLRTLNISQTHVADLTPLRRLSNLRELNLGFTQVSDLASLKGLDNLRVLRVTGTQVSDLSPLKGLTSLRTLYLCGTPVSDLMPLKALSHLEELQVGGDIHDLNYNPIARSQLSDFMPLRGLTNLRRLVLAETQIKDEEFQHLKRALPNCKIERVSSDDVL